jgi:pimeloyl-ACP methyl ester carboxylesterase
LGWWRRRRVGGSPRIPRRSGSAYPTWQGLLARAIYPVVLARGEGDPMVSEADLRALVSEPVTLRGLGHNAHAEEPAAVVELARRFA